LRRTGNKDVLYRIHFAESVSGLSLGDPVKYLGVDVGTVKTMSKVTAIAPGSFRTEWAGRSMVRSGRSIADYDAVFDPVRKRRQEYSGHQPGDPPKAACRRAPRGIGRGDAQLGFHRALDRLRLTGLRAFSNSIDFAHPGSGFSTKG